MEITSPSNRRRSILLLIFSIAGILGIMGRIVYLFVTNAVKPPTGTASDLPSFVLDAVGTSVLALLLLPTLLYSLRLLRGKDIPAATIPAVKFWQLAVLIGIWIFILLLGTLLSLIPDYGWIGTAPFYPFGLILPIVGLVWVSIGGLATGSRRRLWAVLGIGMVGSTMLALLGEYLVVGAARLVGELFLIARPEWRAIVDQLTNQIANANDMEAVLTILAPYLTNPLFFIVLIILASGIVPLIEEAAKPAVLFLLGKHLRSPAEGFALGALCGAGFALMEGMVAASGIAQTWGFGMAGRAASSMMHITVSAMLGWAIASALLKKQYGRLFATYILCAGLHGLWNGSTLLVLYGSLRALLLTTQPDTSNMLISVLVAIIGLGLLSLLFVGGLVTLPLLNRYLRKVFPAVVPAATETGIIAQSSPTDGQQS